MSLTLADALNELGIDTSATPDDAQRAYLRRIEVHKPETDPEGFHRLREAYERVIAAGSEMAKGSISSQGIEPDSLPTPARSSPSPWRLARLLLLLAPVLLRVLPTACPSGSPKPEARRAIHRGALSHNAAEAWKALDGECDGAGPNLPPAACDAAWDAAQKASNGNCTQARAALATLDQHLGQVATSALAKPKAFESRLISTIDLTCRQ
ncbi:MAG TPA: hypothetical protein VGG20_00045 [Thermoanaerobaculia bacterium]|jgi:hypothetical protein